MPGRGSWHWRCTGSFTPTLAPNPILRAAAHHPELSRASHEKCIPDLLPAEWPQVTALWATPGYFDALGMRLLQGRLFSVHDHARALNIAVINDIFARQHFPRMNPIGRRIKVSGSDEWREIIGVVAGIIEIDVTHGIGPQVYRMFTPQHNAGFSFIVRTAGNSAALHAALKQQVYAVDRDQPVAVKTLEERIAETGVRKRFEFHLLSLFSLVALVIATVGIYGVVAYTVSQRTTEIGIRMALGATAGDVAQLIITQGARLICIGLALGLAGALASGRLLELRLYQVSARDPLTLTGIAAFFAVAAAFACWLPARRATKVDPIVALRAE